MPISALQRARLSRSMTSIPQPMIGAASSFPDGGLSGPIELMGARMTFPRNSEIYGEAEPADYLYKVVSGAVRTCKVTADGRRQIGGFYLAGDVFGLESGDEHAYSAEAISDATVLVVRRSAVMAMAERDGDVARQLWTSTAGELKRAQARLMLLVKSAEERVAGFLLEMAERGARPDVVELPMSRQDIADYLGLTIETVSRTLTALQDTATIELQSARHIVLRDQTTLQHLGR